MTLKRTRHLDVYITIKELAEEHPDYPVNRLCKLGHVTRASYYKWRSRPDNENDVLNWVGARYDKLPVMRYALREGSRT